jgi:hypothetical protein
MKRNIFKHILGDLFTTGGGMALGIPTIQDGIELLPVNKTAGILKLVIGVGTLLLGLLTTTNHPDQNV